MKDQRLNDEGKAVVAVYGTLRKGEHNHYLLAHSKPRGKGHTTGQGTMYSAGGFPIVSFDKGTSHIQVELYEVDAATLERLDQLEGYPDWYSCGGVLVALDGGGSETANIYHQPGYAGDEERIIESGDWKQR